MNIPTDVFWEVMLVIGGFVFGTLWGHHTQINKRVTYEECSKKRDRCPCTTEIKKLEEMITSIQKEKRDEN